MANFFAGLGNLAGGLSKGIRTGKEIYDTYEKGKIKRAYSEGIKGAEEKRQSDIEGATKPVYEGGIKMGYGAKDGKVYGSQDKARAAAESQTPDVMEYFMNDAAPRIGQLYLEQGKPEKAQAWDAWVKDKQGKKAVEQWSSAYKSMMTGDFEDAANKFGEFYNDQIDDSVDYRGQSPIKNENGDITGFKMKLYDRDDDEMREIEMTRDQMVQLGNAYNPQALFERITSQTDKASQLAAEAAMEERKSNRDFKQDVALERVKSGNRMEEARTEAQLDAEYGNDGVKGKFDANVGILREQGYSDDEIRDLTPRILGISKTRAGASDTDLRLNAMKMLTGDYVSRREFDKLPPEEQEKKINAIVRMIKATQQ